MDRGALQQNQEYLFYFFILFIKQDAIGPNVCLYGIHGASF